MAKPVSVLSAAKRLGEQSEWLLPHLDMQKLIYMAHMFYMGKHDGEPLVDGKFQAWFLGPIHHKLYTKLKKYGADVIPESALRDVPSIPDDHPGRRYLDAAVKELATRDLIALTQKDGGAWARNYRPGLSLKYAPISKEDLMEDYEKRMMADAAKQRA